MPDMRLKIDLIGLAERTRIAIQERDWGTALERAVELEDMVKIIYVGGGR